MIRLPHFQSPYRVRWSRSHLFLESTAESPRIKSVEAPGLGMYTYLSNWSRWHCWKLEREGVWETSGSGLRLFLLAGSCGLSGVLTQASWVFAGSYATAPWSISLRLHCTCTVSTLWGILNADHDDCWYRWGGFFCVGWLWFGVWKRDRFILPK